MPETVRVIHPKTGQPIVLAKSICDRMVIWSAPGEPLTDEEAAWAKAHLDSTPIRELMAQFV